MTQPDFEIWEKVEQGDTEAFAALFDKYWEDLYARAWRFLKDDSTAKDIVQNIFIHCWEHRAEIHVSDSLAPYLAKALKYSLVRHIYKVAKMVRTTSSLNIDDVPAIDEEYREEWKQMEILQKIIKEEVKDMPPRMQEIFRLNHEEQLSVKSIASKLSISEQTVKNTLHTAMKRLRGRLRDKALFLPFFL